MKSRVAQLSLAIILTARSAGF
jgi:thiol-disulfide isomerase/thioredoxin